MLANRLEDANLFNRAPESITQNRAYVKVLRKFLLFIGPAGDSFVDDLQHRKFDNKLLFA